MPKYATVRELKNQTTALIREVERGKRSWSRGEENQW
jgi:antitoxin (DNA-binding transcriptional repressor) of toxin-antitoxin stability system